MGVLKNSRQERFAQAVAGGMDLGKAYVEAGYNAHESAPTRLSKLPAVRKRIEELLERGAKKVVVTIEKLTEELESARVLSMKDEKGAAAAVQAIMAKAKLHGLDVNRHKVEGGITITISSDDDKL